MTHYLLSNLKSRHIPSNNDFRLDRAKDECHVSDYTHTVWTVYPIILDVVSVVYQLQRPQLKGLFTTNCINAHVEFLLSSVLKSKTASVLFLSFFLSSGKCWSDLCADFNVSSSYLTEVLWWRFHTLGSPHPRYWRPSVWSHSGSCDLEEERDGDRGRVMREMGRHR